MAKLNSKIPLRRSTIKPLLLSSGDYEGEILPGVMDIGRGVDVVTKTFATADSLLENLFQMTDRIGPNDTSFPDRANDYADMARTMGHDTWGLVDVEPKRGGRSTQHKWSGERISSIQTGVKTTAEVEGSYSGFSGQVTMMAASKNARSASAYFCNYHGMFPKYRLQLSPKRPIRDLLKEDVRDALDNWDTDQLIAKFFPKFGGYYLHAGVFGGLVHYSAVRTTSSEQSDKVFSAGMSASYDVGVGSASGSAAVEKTKKHEAFLKGAETWIFAQGGTIEPIMGDAASIKEWQASIAEDPELIDFENTTNVKGCRPVWSLVEETARQAVIRNAFFTFAEQIQQTFDFHDPDLVPLYAYRDWKSYDLRRWFFTTDANYKIKAPWKRQRVQCYVYTSARPGCKEFHCVRKQVEMKTGIFKKEKFYYHKIAQGVPKGWKSIAKFYAPTAPLKATLDKWVAFYPFTRNTGGDYSGQYYDLKNAKPGAWKQKGGLTFYGVRK